ncbi:uncharacterized protein MELLADRAFT_102091 [Melampsora larici-populina 98AG31]|uniref:DUF6589 domain-containing protein n=1 Tax=Melampsora larici-populina (strain 98AG31 / pathotype 3-4-7) TaxID=747676 RepID=F4R5Z1_MELLP|nr:uncharacterized protein MELLADRAFT_102091 [Melampsora larici-populina 98AG31]EGG12170.1 hypothetical protein MELLADRAFT_102091 [Melampsora larici-populina 98AG31]
MTPENLQTASVAIPKTVTTTLLICEYINALGFSPKEFMVTFFSSNHADIEHRRRMMKVGLGVKGTRSIIKNIGKVTMSSPEGRADWENIILDEASAIVNSQEVQRGYFPQGGFASSNRITSDFFGESAEALRSNKIKDGMHFLHTLIHRKLALGMKKKDLEVYDDKDDEPSGLESGLTGSPQPGSEPHIEGAVDKATILSLENLVFVKGTLASLAAHKLETLPTMICSMIAVTCNRRINAIPLANGLMALAAGVTCCVNEWLHAFGMTTSRATVLQAMDRLRVLQEERMKDLLFVPGPNEVSHWVSVIKSQLAKALKEHLPHIPRAPEPHLLPATLKTFPPPIDPIEMHQANIHFLRMMDAPDSSADGVSRVLDAVVSQIGIQKETYAEKLLIAGGDVGSNQLLESLRVKRFPPVKSVEGIEWVLSVFGGAHTTWNFAKAIWSLHWGNSADGEDSGVWRSTFAIGGDYKKPPASQDFNSIMRSLQMIHKANLVFIIKSASFSFAICYRRHKLIFDSTLPQAGYQ